LYQERLHQVLLIPHSQRLVLVGEELYDLIALDEYDLTLTALRKKPRQFTPVCLGLLVERAVGGESGRLRIVNLRP